MMEIGNKNNNNIIYGDGKWLVFIQRNKYKIEDFIYSLGHIKGLFTLKICHLKKEKGFDNNTECLCLYYYGNGSDEDILNMGEELISTEIIKDASVNNYIYYKTEKQIYSDTHKNVSKFKLEFKRDDYFIDSDNET